MEEFTQEKCSCCGKLTYHRLEHNETKKRYPFCLECYSKGLYNKELFTHRSPRGKAITDKYDFMPLYTISSTKKHEQPFRRSKKVEDFK